MAVTITQGTQTNIKTTTDSGAEIQHVRQDGGTLAILTAGTVTNLSTGTINAVAAGTITNGTVQTYGIRHPDAFTTVVSTGTNTMGTIKAGVSGSSIYINWLMISAGSATNVEIGNGGTGLPLIGTLYFNGNGGVAAMPLDPPINTSSGSALVYKQSTAVSPLSITVGGYVD